MHITFYANHHYYGGLNNTGGSRTIVRSARALRELGHEVVIVAPVDRYTWESHVRAVKHMPDKTDMVVAVSSCDIKPMMKECEGLPMAYWMRGWEVWQQPEQKILKRVSKLYRKGGAILTNASHLTRKIHKLAGVDAYTCYAGLDLDEACNVGLRRPGRVRVGCLYPASGKRSTLHKTKRWEDFAALAETLGFKDYEYVAFGNNKDARHWLKRYVCRPTVGEKNALYNSCHVWFAPSVSEGFQNPPSEAGLCGCLIVANACASSGTHDYCNDKTAMQYTNLREAAEQIRHPDYRKVKLMHTTLTKNIGGRRTNMQRLVCIVKGER